jgi:histidyl-tRNA synthetase
VAEIELILATTEALGELGLDGLTVRINDRRVLAAMAAWCGFVPERHGSVFITLDKWDKLPPGEIRRELEHAGHPASAIDRMMSLYAGGRAPVGLDTMRAELGRSGEDPGFTALPRIIDAVRAEGAGRFTIAFDPTLVRGMGYYTGPIFEIGSSSFGAGSIAGGGRYDNMIGALLGRPVPATGFSIGFERVVEILGKRRMDSADRRVAVLFDDSAEGITRALRAARGLRAKGHLVALERQGRSPGAQRAALEKQGYDGAATVDQDGVPSVQWFAGRAAGQPGSRG